MADEIMNFIVVEWDGTKPPTTWYNRLRSMGLRVSGSKKESPLARRVSASGVVYQEGMILTNTQSQAETLYALARNLGAKNVLIGELKMLNSFSDDWRDSNVLSNIQRGRPTRAATKARDMGKTLTCFWEMRSFTIKGKEPPNCPSCGGSFIKVRDGSPLKVLAYDGNELIFDYWTATHFLTGSFEQPEFVTDPGGTTHEKYYDDIIAKLQRTKLARAVDASTITWEKKLKVLSLGYRFLTEYYKKPDVNRLSFLTTNHLEGFAEYYKIADNPRTDGSLSVSDGELSMVDLLKVWLRTQNAISDLTKDEVVSLCDMSM